SQAERAWDNTNGATGGGVAANPTASVGLMPGYQQTALSAVHGPLTGCGGATDCRDVPDVAAMADPGFVIDYCQSGDSSCPAAERVGWQGVAGTSGAAPLWAGIAALVAASPYCAYDATTSNGLLGSFPADLYGTLTSHSAAGQTLYSTSFTDVLTGNNGYYSAGPGYDLSSGLGSPVVAYANSLAPGLAASLCAESGSPPTPTITGISPPSGPDDAAVNVTITGTNFLAASGAEQLKVGSVFATNVSCTSATTCTATVPELDVATSAITPVLTVAGLHQSASSPSYASLPAAPAFAVLASPSSLAYGATSALSVSGLPSDASGTVTFSAGSTTLCSYVLGAATSCATPSTLTAGTYLVSAAYSGDTNFLASSATAALTVTPATASVSVVANPATATFGHSVLLSMPGLASGATGTVTFSSGASTLCSYAIDSASACSTTASLAAGSYSVTASYGGDTNDASASAATTFVVNQASPGSVLVADALPSAAKTGSSVSLLLAGLASGATGTVKFTSGSKLLCSYALPAAGSCRASALRAGVYPVNAFYSGDANFTSASAATRFTVAAAKVRVKGKKCAEHRELVTLTRIVDKHGRFVRVKTTKSIEVKVCTRVSDRIDQPGRSPSARSPRCATTILNPAERHRSVDPAHSCVRRVGHSRSPVTARATPLPGRSQ
ncbi:MAG TPA: Ig-like domain repeat protein, partial [Mycobacteriales bacterium]|nr:Ig-like domain repeat protein [Mycobacteriales bacterium]